MTAPSFWTDLEERGFIHQTTSGDLGAWLGTEIAKGPFRFYAGFDPTSSSLHVGSLLPILGMRRLKAAGAFPIALVGGATGMIGDPSGRATERTLLSMDEIHSNIDGIASQLQRLLEGERDKDFSLVNNADWFSAIKFIDFLRDVGKHFSINAMIARESVRARLEDREQGISYTEFSYALLQAYDFLHLYRTQECRMQVGGSDQWGNIAAGIDLIHHKHHGAVVHGCTFPLLTTSSGQKFGKSERGAIYLDAKRTHPYFLYKYFFDSQDTDAIRYMNLFTFVSLEEISAFGREISERPEQRATQKQLALEVTALVHGRSIAEACEGLEHSMHADDAGSFERHAESLHLLKPDALPADVDSTALPVLHCPAARLEGAGVRVIDLAVESGLFKSKSEARRELPSGALRLANDVVSDHEATITQDTLHGRRVLLLKRGKRHKRMLVFG